MAGESTWRSWPAFDGLGGGKRWKLRCGVGVWCSGPGEGSARWVAASPGFDSEARASAEAIYLGREDRPRRSLALRLSAQCCQVLRADPDDWEARHGNRVLDRVVLDWRNPRGLPGCLAALALLPEVARLHADALGKTAQPGADGIGSLRDQDVYIDELAVSEGVAAGCTALAAAIDLDALTTVYADLVAGNRFVLLPPATEVLSPEALACLLLPVPRALADGCTLLSALPSSGVDTSGLLRDGALGGRGWHLLGPGAVAPSALPSPERAPDAAQRKLAASMAGAVLAGEPDLLSESADTGAGTGAGASPETSPAAASVEPRSAAGRAGTRELRLWGATSTGKTVYLAQLYLNHREYRCGEDEAWSVRLPPGTDPKLYANHLEDFLSHNRFPDRTAPGLRLPAEYHLVERHSGRSTVIAMEDRSGEDYQAFGPEVAEALAAADGLMLLLDPLRDRAVQDEEVLRGLFALQQARGSIGSDPRPLAVCVSKCDDFVHDVSSYRRVSTDAEDLLRNRIGKPICEALRHHFDNYKVFAISAAGLRLRHGAVEPGVFYDESLSLRINFEAEPINLLEPLLWLLKQLPE